MGNISEEYIANHNALTATTKGAAPGNQIMWVAALMTILQTFYSLVAKDVRHD